MNDKIYKLFKDILTNENKTCYECCEKYTEIRCSECPLCSIGDCDCRTSEHLTIAEKYIKDHELREVKLNWEDFENSKIAVHTPTLEGFVEFNKMLRGRFNDSLDEEYYWVQYKEETCIVFSKVVTFGDEEWFKKEGYKIIEFDNIIFNDKEKTLLEIITEGFNNKVYEDKNGNTVYVASNNELIFNYKKPKNLVSNVITEALKLDEKYKLERKEYTTDEALKEFENGIEIEGKYSHNKYKKDPNMNMYKNDVYCESAKPQISFNELFEPWYINK